MVFIHFFFSFFLIKKKQKIKPLIILNENLLPKMAHRNQGAQQNYF
jgi:hypothetical protein